MRVLIAGDGGSVLVRGASSQATALAVEDLARPARTPGGVPVYPIEAIPDELSIDAVELTGCEPSTAEVVKAWAAERSIPVRPVDVDPLPAPMPVVAISSASTGSGKTALTRRVARTLHRSGMAVAVARHPIVDLLTWSEDPRFQPVVVRSPDELGGPIGEREELAPVVGLGIAVVSGLDPEAVLRLAAQEAGPAGVIVWDGGGAAAPWIAADLEIVAVDLLREMDEGMAERVRAADAVVLTKADTATAEATRRMEAWVREIAPDIPVALADLAVGVGGGGQQLRDRDVVVVEDQRSLTLGGLVAGAGAVAARRFRCGVVDPRPFAVGAVAEALERHPHIGPVIPALGRTPEEAADLAASVAATPGEAVLWACNADPGGVIGDERRPIIRAFGELTEVAGASLQEILSPLIS